MTIEISPTKGYGYIKIEIYHNSDKIDFDSIEEAYTEDMAKLHHNEESILKEIKDN